MRILVGHVCAVSRPILVNIMCKDIWHRVTSNLQDRRLVTVYLVDLEMGSTYSDLCGMHSFAFVVNSSTCPVAPKRTQCMDKSAGQLRSNMPVMFVSIVLKPIISMQQTGS